MAPRHVRFNDDAWGIVSVLTDQDDYNIALTDCVTRLFLPFVIRIGLTEGGINDTMVGARLGLSEELISECTVFIKLEAGEYLKPGQVLVPPYFKLTIRKRPGT